jgi:4'-phosphopantetheinyl transferase
VAFDTAEVWLIRADVPGQVVTFLHGLLDERERSRANGWRWAERRRYVVAHGAARLILGDRLGEPPADLRYTYGAQGKPGIEGAQMSLSHSGEFCMLAVTEDRPVGVDIQQLASGIEPVSMAARYFPIAEARFVAAARPVEQAVRFARMWARKEALTKAVGGRLVASLSVPVCVMRRSVVVGGIRITDVLAPPGFRAAIALAGRAGFRVRVRRWRWADQAKRMEAVER